MNAAQLANSLKIAQTFSTLNDDQLTTFNSHVADLPPEAFTGQLARFKDAIGELKMVTDLFQRLSGIPTLAKG